MLALETRQRRGRGAEDTAGALGVSFFERPFEFGGGRLRAREIIRVDEQGSEGDEGRITEAAAIAYLLGVEARVVLRAGVLERVVVRVKGLYQHAPGQFATARAARDPCGLFTRSLRG